MFKLMKSTLFILSVVLVMSSCSKDHVDEGPKEPEKMSITFATGDNGTVDPIGKRGGSAGDTISSVAKAAAANYVLEGWYDETGKINPSEDFIFSDNTLKVKLTQATKDKTYTAKFVDTYISEPGVAAPRIYVVGEGDQAKLMLTKNPTNHGAYFQWGRTVAWNNSGSPVKLFDPNNSQGGASWKEQSVGDYPTHTAANLKVGKGDPCKLVGFTQEFIENEINSGSAPDNGKWCTPTKEENKKFGAKENRSNWTKLDGINGRYFGPGATSTGTGGEFLPASGFRHFSNGTLDAQGTLAFYWSCTLHLSSNGYNLNFYQSGVTPENDNLQAYGYSVRCVPQRTTSCE
ncbi:MAG: hypothetical protein ACRCZY_06290 [Phocaeicola sp.]